MVDSNVFIGLLHAIVNFSTRNYYTELNYKVIKKNYNDNSNIPTIILIELEKYNTSFVLCNRS